MPFVHSPLIYFFTGEKMSSLFEYSSPVHRVLLEQNQLMKIGVAPAMVILVLTIVLMNIVSIWCVFVGIALYIIARLLCKNDPYMLTILFERLTQPGIWRA